jgi:oligopeptide transport system substrate-binding protein
LKNLRALLFVYILSFVVAFAAKATETAPFRLHISIEPVTLNPLKQKSTSGAFLFTAVHASLLWLEDGVLRPYLADCSQPSSTKIICNVNPNAKFSNGKAIEASHFVRSFVHFLDSKNPGYKADLLLGIKNADKILSGKLPPKTLGVIANKLRLTIELEKPDYEFIYNLANPLFSPSFSADVSDDFLSPQSVFSGPYVIKSWEPKRKITLLPNSYFATTLKARPALEFYFVNEDTVALHLYEKGELDFLRRLPTLYIAKFKDRADFHKVDQFRFDYYGFGPELKNLPDVRKTLAESLDFTELQHLYFAKPRPGCVGIPATLTETPVCIDYKPSKKKYDQDPRYQNLKLSYSKQGGDDIDRSSQWLQAQWKKNLGIQVQLEQLENKVLLSQLQNQASAIFHHGVSPTRPTCYAVLENFLPHAKENWIHVNADSFTRLIKELQTEANKHKKAQLCREAMLYLLNNDLLIPTGPEYFSVLAKPNWVGWKLNEINQLNLSELHSN